MSTITTKKYIFNSKILLAISAMISVVALPQLFHIIGSASGVGAGVGITFLPMHIPVLLAGFIGGPVVGVVVGVASPLISFVFSGMPNLSNLPFMMIEIGVYGLVSGCLYKTKYPIFIKLLIAQIMGRLIRALAMAVVYNCFYHESVPLSFIDSLILSSLPGIFLQWALIPLLVYRMKGLISYYD